MATSLDDVHDPHQWVRLSVEQCLSLWRRLGGRYARHVRAQARRRLAAQDLLALAARGAVPLARPVLRPLPEAGLPPQARAFNRLVEADRRVLLAWARREGGGDARLLAEARASALERLVAGAIRHGRPPP